MVAGRSPGRTFRKVTFPLIFPGVLSAMLFAFTLSYDEFSRTLFASGRDQTLPLAIYGTFSVEIHPNVFAFGVLTTLFSFALLGVYAVLMACRCAAPSAWRSRRTSRDERRIVTGAGSGIGRAIARSWPATATSVSSTTSRAERCRGVTAEIGGARRRRIAGDVSRSRPTSRHRQAVARRLARSPIWSTTPAMSIRRASSISTAEPILTACSRCMCAAPS
jgi:hypothetical protein